MGSIAEALQGADLGAGETPDPQALAKLAQLDCDRSEGRIHEHLHMGDGELLVATP